MTCEHLITDLSLDEAHAVIDPFFEEIRDSYLARGYDRVRGTRLYVAAWAHDTPRHFAACAEDGRSIVVAPEMAELTVEIVGAIVAHELGHATDFLYPGEFVLGHDQVVRRRRDEVSDKIWIKMQKAWEERDPEVVERTADAIAVATMGIPIGYVGPCQLECFNRGTARPQGLR
jgi:hypothetical protein